MIDAASDQAKKTISTLKASKYNHFIEQENKTILGYNFLYHSIIRFPSEAYPQIQALLAVLSQENKNVDALNEFEQGISFQWLEALQETQFIIDSRFDELSLIKFRYYESLYSNDSLTLEILPTLWCNLECPYCFEFKKHIFLENEISDALMNWIQKSFRHKRYINVAWFGGEPLLNKKLIFSLSNRIQKFCSEIGATYNASLTTNGYFLDSNFQENLLALGIKHVQVTFDGDKKDHDALRRQRNGEGSFDRLFQNVVSFCQTVKGCKLTIRINCCDSNYNGVKDLLKKFPPIVRENSKIFFRWVFPNEASGNKEFSSRARCSSFKELSNLYSAANEINWKTCNPHNHVNTGYCEVDYLDRYIIDPEGNVFLCTHTFKKSESIGNVTEENFLKPESISSYVKWYAVNPFEDEECVSCKLLPTCIGGCRKERFKGRKQCIEEKHSLDLFVQNLVTEHIGFLKNK